MTGNTSNAWPLHVLTLVTQTSDSYKAPPPLILLIDSMHIGYLPQFNRIQELKRLIWKTTMDLKGRG